MNLILILGLAALGVSVASVLRALTMANARSQQTLTRIGAYGFNPIATAERKSFALRPVIHRIDLAFGLMAERHTRLTRAKELRALLNSAGLYRHSVASILVSRVLTRLRVSAAWL